MHAYKEKELLVVSLGLAFKMETKTRTYSTNKIRLFSKYEGKAREVLEALLDKYAKNGILVFGRANILEIPPFNLIGKPTKIIKLFGGPAGFEQAIKELEEQIYKVA